MAIHFLTGKPETRISKWEILILITLCLSGISLFAYRFINSKEQTLNDSWERKININVNNASISEVLSDSLFSPEKIQLNIAIDK